MIRSPKNPQREIAKLRAVIRAQRSQVLGLRDELHVEKQRVDLLRPGRVERRADAQLWELRFRIDDTTLSFAASPADVINDAVEHCRRELYRAVVR